MKLRKDLKLHTLIMRGWVEIRSAIKPPTPVVTHHIKDVMETIEDPNHWPPTHYINRPVRVDLVTTTWKGGRVLGSMRLNAFRDLLGRHSTRLRRDSCHTFEQTSPAGRRILRHLSDRSPE